jgi:PAS domain S-box-containing protein
LVPSEFDIAYDVMLRFRMNSDELSRARAADFLAAGGEMGALMRVTDWTRTPVGPPQSWPISLKTAVGIMMSSRYAMFVWWGRHLANLYNDAYRPFLGKKHPNALGQSARDVWKEIWDLIGPRTEAVLERAESTFDEALLLVMDRFGYPEETYFTFSYSPLRNDRREVGGIFAAVTDETLRVIGERRLRLLREIAAASSRTHIPEQVCAVAAECISPSARDLPFALLYLTDPGGKTARLAAQVGMEPGSPGAASCVELNNAASRWPLAQAASNNALVVVEDLSSRFEQLPTGAWDRAPDRAAVVPLGEQGQAGVAGFLIVGLNPYLVFDEKYRGFIELLGGQIAAGIANARAYQEERKRAETLAEIDRAKTAFFSNVSHEFRTPLTLILGSLEDLLAKPPDQLARDGYELGAIAQRSGLRLLKLVNTLLDFSRIEAGRAQACYEPTDLASLTAELVSNFQSACDKAGLSLDVDFPPIDEPVYVDREMWEKIVLNLVSNAFKFTHAGGITVALHRDGNQVALSVRDTGIGISEGEIPRLFERFHRVEGARGRGDEGTGIGLALVQELIKLQQGSIDVVSSIGRGTTFTVRLPFGSAHVPSAQIEGARTQIPNTTRAEAFVSEALGWLPGGAEGVEYPLVPSLQNPGEKRSRILVADDNADMREYLRRALATRYDVISVSDGKEALVTAAEVHPDLVLTDVMMPSLDGFALLEQLRANPDLQEIPVIVLSARAGEEAKIDGLRMGADDYIVKPFSSRELLARVSSILDLAAMRRREAQKLRQEVKQLDARYRLMVDAVTDYAIYMLDHDGIVTSWNAGGRRFKGYDDAEIIGQHFSRFYTEEDQTAGLPAKALATASRDGKFEGEGWRVRKNGERFWAHVVVDPIRDHNGEIIGFTKITRDVTERHEAQRALETARDRMLQAQKMEAIGQLTGGIAHDFNNLLAAILGSLELLQRRVPKELPQLMRLVDNAVRGAQRGAALTQRMLAFARRQELNLEPVDIPALVRGMTELLERSIGPTITIETRFPLGLSRVTADPNQLEMALLNLIVNARDAMPNGGGIIVSARPASVARDRINDLEPGEYVCLSVVDAGEGMDEATLARAMDPFFTTKEPGKGTGLGLPMVHGLAQQSGGRLLLKSRKGEGTTAELWLPTAKGRAAVSPEVVAEPEKKAKMRPLEVVVVDDDSLVLTNMAAMLEDLGHRVFEASSGQQALEILRRESTADLVITDYAMPKMTGLQLIQQIRAEWPAMPVILATGYAELPRDADPTLPKLAKPFFQNDLMQAVNSVVRGGRSTTRILQFRQLGTPQNS